MADVVPKPLAGTTGGKQVTSAPPKNGVEDRSGTSKLFLAPAPGPAYNADLSPEGLKTQKTVPTPDNSNSVKDPYSKARNGLITLFGRPIADSGLMGHGITDKKVDYGFSAWWKEHEVGGKVDISGSGKGSFREMLVHLLGVEPTDAGIDYIFGNQDGKLDGEDKLSLDDLNKIIYERAIPRATTQQSSGGITPIQYLRTDKIIIIDAKEASETSDKLDFSRLNRTEEKEYFLSCYKSALRGFAQTEEFHTLSLNPDTLTALKQSMQQAEEGQPINQTAVDILKGSSKFKEHLFEAYLTQLDTTMLTAGIKLENAFTGKTNADKKLFCEAVVLPFAMTVEKDAAGNERIAHVLPKSFDKADLIIAKQKWIEASKPNGTPVPVTP